MKGFVHIVEAIISSIIILTSLSFFLTPVVKQSNWDSSFAEVRAQDAISAAYANGSIQAIVRQNNGTLMRDMMEKLLGQSTDFTIDIIGIPNPEIYVGCNCSAADVSNLETDLAPLNFTYKGRTIDVRIQPVSALDPKESDIILFTSADDLNDAYSNAASRNSIEKFLENGGTVMLIGDITQPQSSYPAISGLFNISWNGNGNPKNSMFHNSDNTEFPSYNIAKYYSNVSGFDASSEIFDRFDIANDINKVDIDNFTIIRSENKQFSLMRGVTSVINGNGRALWMADYSTGGNTENLTKAAMM